MTDRFITEDGNTLARIDLSEGFDGDKPFRLETGFRYIRSNGDEFPASEGLDTDLASVPWPMWGLVAPFGKQSRAALIHDEGCDMTNVAEGERYDKRRKTDYAFRDALVASNVSVFRAWMMWTGVSFARYFGYRRLRGVALILAILAWWLLVVLRLLSLTPWQGVSATVSVGALAGAVLVGAILMWSDWNLLLFVLAAFPLAGLVFCVVALDWLVQLLLWFIASIVSIFGGPPAVIKPTVFGMRST